MIHPTAVIDKNASVDKNVEVGPYVVIETGVRLSRGVRLGPYVHIAGNVTLGENTSVATGAVIGAPAQMKGMYETKKGAIYIGKDNIIREYVTVHAPSKEEGATSIGQGNFLMAFSHIAHDCRVGNNTVICNGALIAGHVDIADNAFISGNTVVHQFVRIGRYAMIAGLARVNQDVPPFMMVVGDSRVWGINAVGVRRARFAREELAKIRQAHAVLYRKNLSLKTALSELHKIESDLVKELIVFIVASKRGICGPKKSSLWETVFLDYPCLIRSRIPAYGAFLKIYASRRFSHYTRNTRRARYTKKELL